MKQKKHLYWLSVIIVCLSLNLASTSQAEQCETDGPDGRWIEITQVIPEGNCLDTVFIRRYKTGGIYAKYYLEGKSNRYKIVIPTGKGLFCLTGQSKECNCNELDDDAIAKDAYKDCWDITPRCYGSSCTNSDEWGVTVPSPYCEECWSSTCWYIRPDNFDYRRRVFEWVCNDCRDEYDDQLRKCEGEPILNWDNATCSGTCSVDELKNQGPPECPDKDSV